MEHVEVTSRAEWRAWLKKHHGRTEGIWLVTYKKVVAEKHLGWDTIVEEALCFGWIDSTARTVDEHRRMLYLSPRKPKSMWSKVNKARVEHLIASKRMAAPGLKVIEAAKASGAWNTLDAMEAFVMPTELVKALAKNRTARKHFDAFPPSARKYLLWWIGSAKTETTRTKRIVETVTLAAKNIRANQPNAKPKA